jgi:hypothetical protein
MEPCLLKVKSILQYNGGTKALEAENLRFMADNIGGFKINGL